MSTGKKKEKREPLEGWVTDRKEKGRSERGRKEERKVGHEMRRHVNWRTKGGRDGLEKADERAETDVVAFPCASTGSLTPRCSLGQPTHPPLSRHVHSPPRKEGSCAMSILPFKNGHADWEGGRWRGVGRK